MPHIKVVDRLLVPRRVMEESGPLARAHVSAWAAPSGGLRFEVEGDAQWG